MKEDIFNNQKEINNHYDLLDTEELRNIKIRTLNKGFDEITNKDLISSLVKLGSLSFLLIIFSVIFIDIKWDNQPVIGVLISYIPILVFVWFVYLFYRANAKLKEELLKLDSTEAEVSRIIDKYSGIIDGIGTALPLFGAALILYIIAQIDPNFDTSSGLTEPHKLAFTEIALPFEIKSLLVLAAAKLFESVFDQLALRYQEVIEHVKDAEKVYYFNEHSKILKDSFEEQTKLLKGKIKDIKIEFSSPNKVEELSVMENIIEKISDIELPDSEKLIAVQNTLEQLSSTISQLNNENISKLLEYISIISNSKKKS